MRKRGHGSRLQRMGRHNKNLLFPRGVVPFNYLADLKVDFLPHPRYIFFPYSWSSVLYSAIISWQLFVSDNQIWKSGFKPLPYWTIPKKVKGQRLDLVGDLKYVTITLHIIFIHFRLQPNIFDRLSYHFKILPEATMRFLKKHSRKLCFLCDALSPLLKILFPGLNRFNRFQGQTPHFLGALWWCAQCSFLLREADWIRHMMGGRASLFDSINCG